MQHTFHWHNTKGTAHSHGHGKAPEDVQSLMMASPDWIELRHFS